MDKIFNDIVKTAAQGSSRGKGRGMGSGKGKGMGSGKGKGMGSGRGKGMDSANGMSNLDSLNRTISKNEESLTEAYELAYEKAERANASLRNTRVKGSNILLRVEDYLDNLQELPEECAEKIDFIETKRKKYSYVSDISSKYIARDRYEDSGDNIKDATEKLSSIKDKVSKSMDSTKGPGKGKAGGRGMMSMAKGGGSMAGKAVQGAGKFAMTGAGKTAVKGAGAMAMAGAGLGKKMLGGKAAAAGAGAAAAGVASGAGAKAGVASAAGLGSQVLKKAAPIGFGVAGAIFLAKQAGKSYLSKDAKNINDRRNLSQELKPYILEMQQIEKKISAFETSTAEAIDLVSNDMEVVECFVGKSYSEFTEEEKKSFKKLVADSETLAGFLARAVKL